jgi:hypothetical protein
MGPALFMTFESMDRNARVSGVSSELELAMSKGSPMMSRLREREDTSEAEPVLCLCTR